MDFSDALLVKRAAAYNKAAEMEYQVERSYRNELARQAGFARTLSALSPAVLYDQVVQQLAKTGIPEYERFLDGVFLNWKIYRQFTDDNLEYNKRLAAMLEFAYASETVSESYVSILPGFLLLSLMGLLCIITAFVVFLRKDVR
jgi:hypothetical protein